MRTIVGEVRVYIRIIVGFYLVVSKLLLRLFQFVVRVHRVPLSH